jgi:5'-methylthioadenosine phosphorylase
MHIAVIGGSGFYDLLHGEMMTYTTPFGQSTPITTFEVDNLICHFLARHGKKHSIPPHLVNYRANIYALREHGVSHIIATNAVGSFSMEVKPGDFVVPDQLIDFTHGRDSTFFTGGTESDIPDEFRIVKHIDVSHPYQGAVREAILNVLSEHKAIEFHKDGTYVCTNGPRFETAAEIQMAKQVGGHIVGMTSAPEVFLARELEMDYASICLVTNYGAGIQKRITQDEVIELFSQRIKSFKDIIIDCIKLLGIQGQKE